LAELSEIQKPAPGQAGYLDVLRRNPGYRWLWSGEVVSLFGDWFNLIASAALVASLTQSGLAVGGLFVVRMLAPFLVSPLAGVLADRYNRKHLLVLSDIIRAVVVLGFLFVREPGQVWVLYALTAVQLGISGFFFPARNALLPDIVSPRELGAANALSSATWSVMLALGAAMGGVVAGVWGIYPAFVIDSLTFLLSAVLIARIGYTAPVQAEGVSLSGPIKRYIEGLRYLKDHRDILSITLHKGAIALAVNGGFQVVMVALAEQVYVIGEGGGTSLGIFYAVGGVGTGLGPIVARRFTGDREASLRLLLVWSYILAALGLAISASLANFGVVLFGSFLRSLGGGINWVFSTQLLLQLLPAQVRGRVFSTEFAIFTLSNAAGAAAAGWIFDNTSLGLSGLIWVMVPLALLPGLLWGVWMVSRKNASLGEA
jgi:MFS family permease